VLKQENVNPELLEVYFDFEQSIYFLKNMTNIIAGKFRKAMAQLNQRGLILMYHRIIALDRDPWQLCVSPSHFEEQMQIIKKYARIVKMKDMGRNLNQLNLGRKEVVVSFDDGYSDNYHNARPILEKNEIAATFFIVSGAVSSNEEFWWDELGRVILTTNTLPKIFELTIGGKDCHWKISDGKKREASDYGSGSAEAPQTGAVLNALQLYFALWEVLSHLPLLQKKEVLLQIGKWAGDRHIPRADYLPMKPSEITVLARHSLFEIGAHTFNHPMLSRLSADEQEDEIARSKHDLENMIERPIMSFSYPHGSYSEVTIEIVNRLKFHHACTVGHGLVTRKTNPFLLPRFTVLDWDGDLFEQNLRKWLEQSGEGEGK